jgi:hypothetical protein
MAVGSTARIRCREEMREHWKFKAAVDRITEQNRREFPEYAPPTLQ